MQKPVLISGSLAYDRIMDFDGFFRDHFVADALHNINVSFLVSPPEVEFGGCAGNIAYSLSLFKEEADIAEVAGNDFEDYHKRLNKLTIGTDLIQIADGVPTASAYIMTDKGDNQISAFSEGASAHVYEKEIDVSRYALVLIGTASTKNSHALAERCKAGAVPYFFDPSQKLTAYTSDQLRSLIEGAAGLLVNDYELKMLMEKTGWSEEDIKAKVAFIIVTLGKDGSRVVTKDGDERVNAAPVSEVVDPTGAGDAFRAGFLKGYIRQKPLTVCARMGSVAAAYAIESYGTQNHTFDKTAFDARYEAAYGEAIPASP
jgi:adenosine kinase